MNQPVFSVIVPIYKVENYLGKCVQSIINQTYLDIEIILVDDGSPDRCPEICDEYAENDKRVKVIHKANGGLSEARNAGLNAANGTYVIFVDADDYIEKDACERFAPFTKQNYDIIAGDGVAEGACKKLTQKPRKNVCFSGKEYLKHALNSGSMPMASWLYIYRREFLTQNDLFFKVGITHEDEQFTPRAFLKAKNVVNSGILFYRYIIREGSITMKKDLRKNLNDLYETCLELEKLYSDIDDKKLKELLKDSLVIKYLSLFQDGKGYQYGEEYIQKNFVMRNVKQKKTRFKAMLFAASPKLYWHINKFKRWLHG